MPCVKFLERVLPWLVVAGALALWWGLMGAGILNDKIVPWPADVLRGLGEEIGSHRLLRAASVASGAKRMLLSHGRGANGPGAVHRKFGALHFG